MCIALYIYQKISPINTHPHFQLVPTSIILLCKALYVFIGFLTHFLTVIMLIHCFPNLCIIKFICIGRWATVGTIAPSFFIFQWICTILVRFFYPLCSTLLIVCVLKFIFHIDRLFYVFTFIRWAPIGIAGER